ncbi:MAG: hypothetical protein ACLGSD_00805 [Acidobacteriota bacterium]
MRQNGLGTLTLEDARTWIEETGLCLFLPKRQLSASLAPSFVEAVAGQRNPTPDPKHIALSEELLVRLELDGVAVRLNLLGQPGEQPDYVVAAWVLPYVYALRGDRDWRRVPQLTGSRAVSPLAVQAYKRLETGEATIAELKQSLGHGVSEMAVIRAITELWQQLRIIPVIAAPGKPAKWQLLRTRFQKAIAEGASTSQVTAISVLASIFLQAVIAASMEEVEIFLSPLTARSKIREVIRGLVATRQVHTLAMGHAPHFYVAGTLPEFTPAPTIYASSTFSTTYFGHDHEPEELPASESSEPSEAEENATSLVHGNGHRHGANRNGASRPGLNRPKPHNRDRKPAPVASRERSARPSHAGHAKVSRTASGKPSHHPKSAGNGTNGSGTRKASNGHNGARPASAHKRNGAHGATGSGPASPRSGGSARPAANHRANGRPAHPNRKPLAAGARSEKRLALTGKSTTKKRG